MAREQEKKKERTKVQTKDQPHNGEPEEEKTWKLGPRRFDPLSLFFQEEWKNLGGMGKKRESRTTHKL